MTGQAYSTGEIVYSSKISEMKNFLPSIDNVSGTVETVHQLAVVPVYGHRRQEEDEGIVDTPIAII